jgi:hypothetical protein
VLFPAKEAVQADYQKERRSPRLPPLAVKRTLPRADSGYKGLDVGACQVDKENCCTHTRLTRIRKRKEKKNRYAMGGSAKMRGRAGHTTEPEMIQL